MTKKAKTGDKESVKDLALLEKFKGALEAEKLASSIELNEEESILAQRYQCLTQKKFLVVANTAEESFVDFDESVFRSRTNIPAEIPVIAICAQIEAELAELDAAEVQEFLAELGAKESGLEHLIHESFDILGLQSYFTAGVQEVRAWTIHKGDTAPQAAGAIHTDFEKGFIKADTIAYEDLSNTVENKAPKKQEKCEWKGKIIKFKMGT